MTAIALSDSMIATPLRLAPQCQRPTNVTFSGNYSAGSLLVKASIVASKS